MGASITFTPADLGLQVDVLDGLSHILQARVPPADLVARVRNAIALTLAAGGALRDLVSGLARQGAFGPALAGSSVGYSFVYHLEILVLFATLVAIGPLAQAGNGPRAHRPPSFGLAEFPG